MSRYPFRECFKKVLRENVGYLAESTLEVTERRYNRMEREFTLLLHDGKVSTLNPKKFSVADIRAYHEFRKSVLNDKGEKISSVSMSHDFNDLRKLCSYFGNDCVVKFRDRCPALTHSRGRSRYPPLMDGEMKAICERGIQVKDFKLLRSYAVVALYLGGGLRTVEVQNSKVCNLNLEDLESPTIYLDVVKGSGSYGENRIIPLIPQFVPIISFYLEQRQTFLELNNAISEYVFFSLDKYEKITDKSIRYIRRKAEEDCSLKFDGRKCRRTYAQYLKDIDIDIEQISVALGHSSTMTTERFYARQKQDTAVSNIAKVMNSKKW